MKVCLKTLLAILSFFLDDFLLTVSISDADDHLVSRECCYCFRHILLGRRDAGGLVHVVFGDSSAYFCFYLVRSKIHKRLKERFLIGRNRTTLAHFRGSPLFFKLRTTTKQTINSTYLVSVGCGKLAERKRA